MEEIIEINRRGVFTLEEVRRVLPVVRRITEDLSEKVEALVQELDSKAIRRREATVALEKEINAIVDQWHCKMKKLGAIPKGLWLVDFEFGRGYYCWKYPEEDILYWHTPDDGYSGRRPLEESRGPEDQRLDEKKNRITKPSDSPSPN